MAHGSSARFAVRVFVLAGRRSGHVEHLFGQGGGERIAAQYGKPLLGSLPLDIGIREQGDAGTPIVASVPDSPAAAAYRATARRLAAELARRPRAPVSLGAQLV